jgi:purine-binding chemotaxis protein CheW
MTGREDMQAVVFGLDQEVFALPVGLVREILDHREAFRIPHGPAWLVGLTDVRGSGVPMVDLRVRLGLLPVAATLATRVLVVDLPLDGRLLTLGLIVDRVMEVSAFITAEVEPAPDIGARWRSDYIDGVVRRDGGFVILLDLARIFADAEDATLLTGLDRAA